MTKDLMRINGGLLSRAADLIKATDKDPVMLAVEFDSEHEEVRVYNPETEDTEGCIARLLY